MDMEAYLIAWNEADTIKFTIRHYQLFCSKVVIYDNYSTDSTPDIAREMGCEVRQFGIKGLLSDAEYIKLKNNCWKGSKAKWVIVADCDEILWHEDIKQVLAESNATIFNTIGFNIFSHKMPKQSFFEIQTGFLDGNYCKHVIFNPRAIQEIGYVFGCHDFRPKGNMVYDYRKLILFHYRHIGGPDRIVQRHAIYRTRMSEHNKRLGLGIHYTFSDEQRVREWHEKYSASKEFSLAGILS